MSFPYIQKLIVNDCYAYQDLTIDTEVQEEGQFKHIILTGPNGSGKTTVLESINEHLKIFTKNKNVDILIKTKNNGELISEFSQDKIEIWEKIKIYYAESENKYQFLKLKYLFTHYSPNRIKKFKNVDSIVPDEVLVKSITSDIDNQKYIKQYLVNKKVHQAFDQLSSKYAKVSQSQQFFDTFAEHLRKIFNDPNLRLDFEQENFEFYISSKGRYITLNQLPDGFAAFLGILMDLLIRTDLIRKEIGDYSYDPEGFVLIDEPETHLHLSMQYEVLPLINTLFPRLQLIVATHSPAVISSLKDAVVYDLGSQTKVSSDELVASSFSELMVRHFGLDNEFSNIADEILRQAGEALKAKDPARLREVLAANERYLTPSLRLELESQLILLKSRMPA